VVPGQGAPASAAALSALEAVLRQELQEFVVATRGRGLFELTEQVTSWIRGTGIREGLLTLHVRHTSASLVIQDNADPEVRRDLERFFTRLVPPGDPLFHHTSEGPDDMPAHVRTALTSTSLSIPVTGGRAALGTWQGIYLYEHRDAPHRRRVAAHLLGE
jgi:secondary thiamine-phosphate synthase enzyme